MSNQPAIAANQRAAATASRPRADDLTRGTTRPGRIVLRLPDRTAAAPVLAFGPAVSPAGPAKPRAWKRLDAVGARLAPAARMVRQPWAMLASILVLFSVLAAAILVDRQRSSESETAEPAIDVDLPDWAGRPPLDDGRLPPDWNTTPSPGGEAPPYQAQNPDSRSGAASNRGAALMDGPAERIASAPSRTTSTPAVEPSATPYARFDRTISVIPSSEAPTQ